ncbi:hypothetical protein AY601_5049 [Pedobacter cryoconitis]|uniref:Uncharacterized protein n=1 Tax=Pedobacter cryoconitis TaxID=188932 RepID=A0A127VKQ9_9SPHI|nr:hypothetical protein [Pedobacter cryoconitis]AMQ01862.1 hypothetical protein AY601_5049 [Pedobacter cryoconitis]
MHRLPILQSLFDAAYADKRSANPTITVSPVYFTILPNNTVRESKNNVMSITGNPDYHVCCIKYPYPSYGKTFYTTELFCFLNRAGDIIEGIGLKNWLLIDINFRDENIVSTATFQHIEKSLLYKYSYVELQFKSRYALTLAELWEMLTEMDSACSTVKEMEIYTFYFLQKKEKQALEFTVDTFKIRLAKEENLIHQHQDLLAKIKSLANGV